MPRCALTQEKSIGRSTEHTVHYLTGQKMGDLFEKRREEDSTEARVNQSVSEYMIQCLSSLKGGKDIPDPLFNMAITESGQALPVFGMEDGKCWLASDNRYCSYYDEEIENPIDCSDCDDFKLLALNAPELHLIEGTRKLAKELNRKKQELAITRELLDTSEDLARLGQQIRSVTHELNNIICSLMGYAQLANLTNEEQDIKKLIEVTLGATNRAKVIIQGLRNAKNTKNKTGIQHIPDILEAAIAHITQGQNNNRIVIKREYSDVPWIIANPLDLQSVFLNICSKLTHDINSEGKIDLAIRHKGEWIEVSISGEASILPEDSKQLFFEDILSGSMDNPDPELLQSECLRESREIIHSLGGKIQARRTKRNKTTFTLKLPLE